MRCCAPPPTLQPAAVPSAFLPPDFNPQRPVALIAGQGAVVALLQCMMPPPILGKGKEPPPKPASGAGAAGAGVNEATAMGDAFVVAMSIHA